MFGHPRKRASAVLVMTALAAVLAFSAPAFARGGGGGGFGGGFGGGPGGGPGGFGGFGGNSAGHISTMGNANTNGPNSPDRDFGLNRARDQMNTQGLDHNQAPATTPGSPR
jgi:hypothetical protein